MLIALWRTVSRRSRAKHSAGWLVVQSLKAYSIDANLYRMSYMSVRRNFKFVSLVVSEIVQIVRRIDAPYKNQSSVTPASAKRKGYERRNCLAEPLFLSL